MIRSLFALTLLAITIPFPALAGPSNNQEMTAIFDADQGARKSKAIDRQTVSHDDEVRRERTIALLNAGALITGADYLHAAFVFQHGQTPDDYLKAHLLAMVAVSKGEPGATWIASATLDRYLQAIGQPQVLGTQFSGERDGHVTQAPFNRTLVPDSLRTMLGVPGLDAQEQRRKSIEAASRPAPAAVTRPALQPIPPSAAARTFKSELQAVSCSQIPGAEQVLRASSLHWLVVGEMHGTGETPAAFADLTCIASASRPVVVAVEQPVSSQAAIDDFIGSDGGEEAIARFRKSEIWNGRIKDGRSSEAYFRLFQRLRDLRQAGRISSVVAFQPSYKPGPSGFNAGDYENMLAATLIDRAGGDGLTLVLVGNAHARRTANSWSKTSYLPMAAYLPEASTITLDARGSGGSYWGCGAGGDCGPHQLTPPNETKARGVTMDQAGGAYTAGLNLGVPFTPSPPESAPAL